MIKNLLIVFCLVVITPSRAQVAFNNPDFEAYSTCPDFISQVSRSVDWIEVVESADFYNCNFQSYGSYPTGTGAYSGDGYMAFASYGNIKGSAEAIGQYLPKALAPGKTYSISLMAKKANGGLYSSNCGGIEIYGFKGAVPPATFGLHVSDIPGTVLLATSAMITDTAWKPQILHFMASDNFDFVAFTVEKVPSCKTYISIDSLSIKEETGSSFKEFATELKLNIYPNPGFGKVTIESDELIEYIGVSDLTGRKIINQTVNTKVFDLQMQTNGVYILTISRNGRLSSHKLIIHN